MTVDVVILSKCSSEKHFLLNCNCIESLNKSEKNINFNIFIIESNPFFDEAFYSYPFKNIHIVKPREHFNFNKFLNIGLALTTNQWIVFANNDLIFHKEWLTEIFKIHKQHPSIQSFCPFDRNSPYLSWNKFNHKDFHIGHRTPIEFVGWCFVTNKSIFNRIGQFDETFDLYFQDNDFALTLKKHKITHALVSYSFVEHFGGGTTGYHDASQTPEYYQGKLKFYRKWRIFLLLLKLKKILSSIQSILFRK